MTWSLFFKLLGPLFIFLIALVQGLLTYRWSDRRTRVHKWIRRAYFPLLIAALICSGFLAGMDDQNQVNLTNQLKSLKEQLTSLEGKLDPFVELAKARFPGLDTETALKRLMAEVKEHAEKITNLERDRSIIRDFGADLTVDFAGGWGDEPWGVLLLPGVTEEFYIVLSPQTLQSSSPLLKFFATEPYKFTQTGQGQARFQARQAVRRGDPPLGKPIDSLSNYDNLGLLIPFLALRRMGVREITITRIEIVFTFNGKRGKPLVIAGSWKTPLQVLRDNDRVAWALIEHRLTPAVWKGMWSN
jgi:hypothetical protein